MNTQSQPRQLIESLQDARVYPHAVNQIQLIETHISWVILTGPFAYKIKKPVNLGFLDFSSLAKRKHFCEEELRLNRRFSTDMYQDVVAITGTIEQPEIDGSENIIEYAVRMREFPQRCLFISQLKKGLIEASQIDSLARTLADFHLQANRAEVVNHGEPPYGSIESVTLPVMENFQQLRPLLQQRDAKEQLQRILDWTAKEMPLLNPFFLARQQNGFIRECHGDLHLGNIIIDTGEATFFDCIEFNDQLRWIDTCSELAFLIMDIDDHGYTRWSSRLLNQYLEITGDYGGLEALRFYEVYRAMVRAKVNAIRLDQVEMVSDERRTVQAACRHCLNLAHRYTVFPPPFLAIMHGISGTGKSWLSERLVEELVAIRLRSDIERKRLFGLTAEESSNSSLSSGIYTRDATDKTYQRLEEIAGQLLGWGFSVIIDATFISIASRDKFHKLATSCSVPFVIVDCQASEETILDRLQKRGHEAAAASEADVSVMRQQVIKQEALTVNELSCTVAVCTEKPLDLDTLKKFIDR